MAILFPVSYVALWVLVIALCLLVVGLLQQVGLLQRSLHSSPAQEEGTSALPLPSVENDGPALGSSLPEHTLETINGFGAFILASAQNKQGTLLLFLAPNCKGCQQVVEPINKIVDELVYDGRVIAILRTDEKGGRSFLSVFSLHIPVVCDEKRAITKGFGVHRAPFGLLYDAQGVLMRKGIVKNIGDLLALLGDESALAADHSSIFPAGTRSRTKTQKNSRKEDSLHA